MGLFRTKKKGPGHEKRKLWDLCVHRTARDTVMRFLQSTQPMPARSSALLMGAGHRETLYVRRPAGHLNQPARQPLNHDVLQVRRPARDTTAGPQAPLIGTHPNPLFASPQPFEHEAVQVQWLHYDQPHRESRPLPDPVQIDRRVYDDGDDNNKHRESGHLPEPVQNVRWVTANEILRNSRPLSGPVQKQQDEPDNDEPLKEPQHLPEPVQDQQRTPSNGESRRKLRPLPTPVQKQQWEPYNGEPRREFQPLPETSQSQNWIAHSDEPCKESRSLSEPVENRHWVLKNENPGEPRSSPGPVQDRRRVTYDITHIEPRPSIETQSDSQEPGSNDSEALSPWGSGIIEAPLQRRLSWYQGDEAAFFTGRVVQSNECAFKRQEGTRSKWVSAVDRPPFLSSRNSTDSLPDCLKVGYHDDYRSDHRFF